MDLTTFAPLPDEGGEPTPTAGQPQAPARPSDQEIVAEVNKKYDQLRSLRKPHEIQWFVSASFNRGKQKVKWNPVSNRLESQKVPNHRSSRAINLILPKTKARLAKFIKTRPQPIVVPASTDHESFLDAKATEKALEYLWRKLGLETKYEDSILWAMITGKSFWWFHWNSQSLGRVKLPDSPAGPGKVVEVPLGDVEVEGGTAFEFLPGDPGVTRLGDQPEIMRVKNRPVADVEQRYGLPKGSLAGETASEDAFQFEKQISQIGSRNVSGFVVDNKTDSDQEKNLNHIAVKELFQRPSAAYPKGRYVAVAGSKMLKEVLELPHEGYLHPANPYPAVEFSDMIIPGQFWPTTVVEQLIGIQEEYNNLRNKLEEQLKLAMHPKLVVPTQAQLHKDAYNSEAGEKITYHFIPGMPPPQFLLAPGVSLDAWKNLEIIKSEFDVLTSIYPASMGGTGDNGESGFQTNLLQEASDSIHAPDIRRNELSIEQAAYKMRHLMSMGYDIPRLLSIVGRNNAPDVFEFSQDNIDEHADVIVQAGSALPTLKAARAKMVMEMHTAALFGDPTDPSVKRRVLGMLEIGGIEDATDMLKRDEDQARLENMDVGKSKPVPMPQPWENHEIHYEFHTDVLKSPEAIGQWSQEQRDELIRHVILHAQFINPSNAMMLAARFGYQDLVQYIQQQQLMAMQFAGPQAGAPAGPPAKNAAGAPPGQAAQAPAPSAPPQAQAA